MNTSEIEVRREYINDEQWDRTSSSWKKLKPRRDFNCFDENDETICEFCQRINGIISIPEPVAEQWLYVHYYNEQTVDNYGWIDYKNTTCTLSTITTDKAIKLRVIDKFKEYVRGIEGEIPFDKFRGSDKDKNYWIDEHTWRVPPIIVDISSFPSPPCHADFSGHYQLIEGHTRLGYLLAMNRVGNKLRENHQVYILRNK